MPRLKNPKHEAFAQARVAGMSTDAAYEEAGYKPHRSNAARLSAKDSVQQRIGELQEAAAERAEMTGAEVLKEIGRVAFSDIRRFFDEHGRLIAVHDLPEDVARAVQSIKVSHKAVPGTDPVEIEHVSEIKFWDKNSALEKLAKHFKLYEAEDKGKSPVDAFLASLMAGAKPLPVASQEGDDV
ncbi:MULTISPECIES: terminase small subunit [unclassified Mameliella]|uniref:terminase small subunit n=1 Tax=Mameliella sp. LZ-28 TaxID=2484146 RepID=UPI00143F0CD3|nr:terminase small subunit [Mameliella sp. LZ-28]MCR9276236.1 terminase small subunit [Paracoccaceae bacterium]